MESGQEYRTELADLCEFAEQHYYYRVLGASPSMSAKEIDRKIDQLIHRYPPEDYPEEWQHLNLAVNILTNPELRKVYDVNSDLCRRVEKSLLKKLPEGLLDRIRQLTWKECETELNTPDTGIDITGRIQTIAERVLNKVPEILHHHKVFLEKLPAQYVLSRLNPNCELCHGTGTVDCPECHGRGCYSCGKKGKIKCECFSSLVLVVPKTVQDGAIIEARVLVQPGESLMHQEQAQYVIIDVLHKSSLKSLFDVPQKFLHHFIKSKRK